MTDREKVLEMLKNFILVVNEDGSIQLSNSSYGEEIMIEFDEEGNISDIYS